LQQSDIARRTYFVFLHNVAKMIIVKYPRV